MNPKGKLLLSPLVGEVFVEVRDVSFQGFSKRIPFGLLPALAERKVVSNE